jgi:hypothetical protein
MVHACEVANQGERDIAGCHDSAFNQLFEAALVKELDVEVPDREPGLGLGAGYRGEAERREQSLLGSQRNKSKGNNKEGNTAKRSGRLRERARQLWELASRRPPTKWTSGVDLTKEDLALMVRGADQNYKLLHSVYDDDLRLGKLRGSGSLLPDPNELENLHDSNVKFDELSPDITHLRELEPHEFPPAFSFPPLHYLGASDPDPAFIRKFTSWKKKGKERMKEEVDRRESPSSRDSSLNTHTGSWFPLPPKDYVPHPTSLSLAVHAKKLMQTSAPTASESVIPRPKSPILSEDLVQGVGFLG